MKTKVNDDWLYKPGRTEVFQAWIDSLESKKVKRAAQSVYLPQKPESNWSTSRR